MFAFAVFAAFHTCWRSTRTLPAFTLTACRRTFTASRTRTRYWATTPPAEFTDARLRPLHSSLSSYFIGSLRLTGSRANGSSSTTNAGETVARIREAELVSWSREEPTEAEPEHEHPHEHDHAH